MERYPEITWPDEYSEFKTFENLLKCQICYDYMDTPVVTSCSHNYCSLCIRKYLHYKTRCPLCFKDAFENELRPNRLLEEIITQFGKIREKLKNLVKVNNHADNSNSNLQTTRLSKESVNKKPMTRSSRKSTEESIDINKEIKKGDSNNNDGNTKALKRLSKSETPESASNESEDTPNSKKIPSELIKVSSSKESVDVDVDIEKEKNINEKVICSVCKVEVLIKHQNKHVEMCKEREMVPNISPKTESKRKPLPKLVINLMKDAELKRKMKELGLPTQGARKTLETRYQRYCTLYNAECDKKKPRSVAELLKQCKDDEALEKKLSKVS